jgi:type IV pilus assembly protein PilE
MSIYLPQRGFMLIELLVTITIVGILATIAMPSYLNHVTIGRRIDGKSALLNMSSAMERYNSQHHTYTGATVANLGLTNLTPNGTYTLSIASATATTYHLQAAPTPPQATHDAACGTLTLNHLGQKGVTGTDSVANCWQT